MTKRYRADKTWFTADTHFGHVAMIRLLHRPYWDTEQMNEALIENHNKVVGPLDTVFHLGDVSFVKPSLTAEILQQLNGIKILVKGNHDKQMSGEVRKHWLEIHDYLEIDIVEPYQSPIGISERLQRISLMHYAMRVWNRHHYGAWQLHGHSHGSLMPIGRQLDVGVDPNNYTPISYWQVKEKISGVKVQEIDHHRDINRT